MLNIIAAMTSNRIIGLDNTIPWYIPEDLKNFKSMTRGHPIIMGRNTYEQIGRQLPDRENIVISKTLNNDNKNRNFMLFNNLDDALEYAEQINNNIFIIGGQRLYEDTIDIADKLYLSIIKRDYKGNKFFPEFSKHDWKLEEYKEFKDFDFCIYNKR